MSPHQRKNMRLDIVLLPPKKISAQIGAAVRGLHGQIKLALAVDNQKLLPHISLLHLIGQKKSLKELGQVVGGLAGKYRKVKIIFTRVYAGKYFFTIRIKNSRALFAIHKAVVKSASPLRHGRVNLPPGKKRGLQGDYIQKFGVGNILEFFSPHITLL